MNILVTGASGQLGSEFHLLAKQSTHSFFFCDVQEMDLSVEDSIISFLSEKDLDIVINCGAYTDVDGAEDNKALAFAINATAPRIIAKHCSANATKLIHISTDYVFDGKGNLPIHEEGVPNPLSVYGKSKLKGEENILQELDTAYIIRTAWVYSAYGKNFLKTMLNLGRDRSELNVVYDQIGSPTYAADLAAGILEMINQWPEKDNPGIYHFSNHGVISWYDFAKTIFDLCKIDCRVNPIRSSEFRTKATRPIYSVLSKEKISNTFNVAIPYWKDSLVKCLSLLESKNYQN